MLRKNLIIKFKIVIIEEGMEDIRIILTPTQLRNYIYYVMISNIIVILIILLRNVYIALLSYLLRNDHFDDNNDVITA